jgi:hypothetical protein
LGPAEDCNADSFTFWNPIMKHSLESCLAGFLHQTYEEFNKLDEIQIASQIATITDRINKMLDENEYGLPGHEGGNQLPIDMKSL